MGFESALTPTSSNGVKEDKERGRGGLCVCVCVRKRASVGETQSGIAPCENDLLPVISLSNGFLFSDVWRREGEVLRGVFGGGRG